MRSSMTCPTHCVRGKYGPRCHVPSRGHERTQQEITTHTKRGHWKIMKVSNVLIGTRILPAVSAMRRKRRIMSREVYKWKARLKVHGGKQTHGVDYWETYAAALNWSSIRFFLTQALVHGWHTRQLNFVLAYPQDADVECNLYLEILQGFTFEGSRKTHCLKLIKNLYGSKAAGRVWQQHLFKGLADIGFKQSDPDDCILNSSYMFISCLRLGSCISCCWSQGRVDDTDECVFYCLHGIHRRRIFLRAGPG